MDYTNPCMVRPTSARTTTKPDADHDNRNMLMILMLLAWCAEDLELQDLLRTCRREAADVSRVLRELIDDLMSVAYDASRRWTVARDDIKMCLRPVQKWMDVVVRAPVTDEATRSCGGEAGMVQGGCHAL